MLPIRLFFGDYGDGADQQAAEIRAQKRAQQCKCQNETSTDKIIGKSSETIETDADATRSDPGRYGTEYHLECTLADYL